MGVATLQDKVSLKGATYQRSYPSGVRGWLAEGQSVTKAANQMVHLPQGKGCLTEELRGRSEVGYVVSVGARR